MIFKDVKLGDLIQVTASWVYAKSGMQIVDPNDRIGKVVSVTNKDIYLKQIVSGRDIHISFRDTAIPACLIVSSQSTPIEEINYKSRLSLIAETMENNTLMDNQEVNNTIQDKKATMIVRAVIKALKLDAGGLVVTAYGEELAIEAVKCLDLD